MATFDNLHSTIPDPPPGFDARSICAALERVLPPGDQGSSLARQELAKCYLSNLMAATGHDLRQPLQVISLALSLLERTSGVPFMAAPLKLTREAIAQLAAGLDHLAFASSLVPGSDAPTITTFPVAEVFHLLESMWRYPASRKGLRLRIVDSSAHVASDLSMLTSIVGNLVGNAIKYTRKGGVLVGCRRNGDRLSIQVVDSGIGIGGGQIGAIFVPFHQEDPEAAGLGLGLAIVQRSAELLGHRVWAKSVVGRGSVFSVEVPLRSRSH